MKLLIIFCLMSSCSLLAFGQSKMTGCAALPWESDQKDWNVGQILPDALNKEDVVKSLRPQAVFDTNPTARGEIVLGVGAKPWAYVPGTYVVVLETQVISDTGNGDVDMSHFLSLELVKIDDSSNVIVLAKTSKPFKYGTNYGFNRFDLAAYKITENEYAFGIRSCSIFAGTGSTTSSESLDLYIASGENIEKIFSTPIGYEERSLRGNTKDDQHLQATISIAATKTEDYFDLIKKFGSAKSAVFHWNGKKYEMNGTDPFPHLADETIE